MNRPPLSDKDGEVRELTLEDMRLFRPVAEVEPGLVEAMANFKKKLGGRPKVDAPKVQFGFRMASDLADGIKATGKGYTARVERVLRKALESGELDAAPSDLFDPGTSPKQ